MKNFNEPLFTVNLNKLTNDATLIVYHKSKIKITKSEAKQILTPGKIEFRNAKAKVKLLIQIFSKFFPEYVIVDGDYAFITAFDIDSTFEKLNQYFIESRRCKRLSVIVTKDFKCSKYYDCLIANKGRKPKYCIAQTDKSENNNAKQTNNHQLEPKILLLEKLSLEPEIYNHYMNIINNYVEQELKNLTLTINVTSSFSNTNVNSVQRNNDFVIKDFEDEETLITLYEIEDISEEAYQKIIDSSTQLLHQILKSVCPFVILTDYSKQIGGLGTCKILSKKAKPIRVNARQPYVFSPKVRTCCYEQYKFGEFQKCWVYQTYYKKHDSDDEIEIEVTNNG